MSEPGTDLALTEEFASSDGSTKPKEGTLLWLALQPHVELQGRTIPACHRVPAEATLRTDAERGNRCALQRADGTACGAPGTRRYGLCLIHSGGGAADVRAMGALGAAKVARLRVTRELLGIGPRSNGNPRAVARLQAAARADDIAAALLSPLDSHKLAPLEKQRAAVVIMDATFPLQRETAELSIPASADDVGSMDWRSMQALAAQLARGEL